MKFFIRITKITTFAAGLLLLNGAAQADTFKLTLYGIAFPYPAVQDNISDYTNIYTGTFDIANPAVAPNNLILFRDPQFLDFDLKFATSVRTYDYKLHDSLVRAPGFPGIPAQAIPSIPDQGIRLDAAGLPERFDTPSTSYGNTADFVYLRDFHGNAPSEFNFWDDDGPGYRLLAGGDIVSGNDPRASAAIGRFGGTWTFYAYQTDDPVIYDGLYTITPVTPTPTSTPEPGTGIVVGLGLLSASRLWGRRKRQGQHQTR